MSWMDRREEKEAFIAHCSTALQVMLHWSKDRADRWASHTWDRQSDNPFFLHEHTSWYVRTMFLPPSIRSKWGTKPPGRLDCQIEMILVAAEGRSDWQHARKSLQQLLSQHDARLPGSEEQADQEGWGE